MKSNLDINQKIQLLTMYRDGVKLDEMAAELGIPVQNVKNFIYRNIRPMRQQNPEYLNSVAQKRYNKLAKWLPLWEEFYAKHPHNTVTVKEWQKVMGSTNYYARTWRGSIKKAMVELGMEIPDHLNGDIWRFRGKNKLPYYESKSHNPKPKGMVTSICPYCGKEGGKSVMTRWHGENCSKKSSK